MENFVFLSRDVVLAIHEEQLAQHGGGIGVRDEGLLESALARAVNRAMYDDRADVPAIAADYAFGIPRITRSSTATSAPPTSRWSFASL